MNNILTSNQYKLFTKYVDDNKKIIRNIIYLYENYQTLTTEFVDLAFDKSYKNFNHKNLFNLIHNFMIKIERIKRIKGSIKKELLISYLIFIIIKFLPVDEDIKELLINLIKEVIPDLIEILISASKKLNTNFNKLKKKICC